MTRVINWRKSSYSQNTGDCVEVGRVTNWRKSSRSQSSADCVEVGALSGGAAVRDTKDRDGGFFVASPAQWADFVVAVKTGRFER
ncbi:DUF397 domain-containing protein [Saccharopolyspora sp. NPDC050389]|uniref:DUF397 domain-containing protein n=1 Tax=Saccharopolyspora sp. NPDC050389 TaxID=3155516 RepID=UPI0033C0ECD2